MVILSLLKSYVYDSIFADNTLVESSQVMSEGMMNDKCSLFPKPQNLVQDFASIRSCDT